jgi:uncharacterized protein YmfQ (DUF2313 family)
MALTTDTARRILGTLPVYYHGNDFLERVAQALGNEIDRIDQRLSEIRDGLIPSTSGDTLGMLALWEATLGLPVAPPTATVEQRRDKILARFQAINASSSQATIAALETAAGGTEVVVHENTPTALTDTLEIPYDPGSYNSAMIEAAARIMWPAHRDIETEYSEGFILDVARIDEDLL